MESTAVSAGGSPLPVPASVPPDTTVSLEVKRLPVDELPGGVDASQLQNLLPDHLSKDVPLERSARPKAAFYLVWHSPDPPHSLLYSFVPCLMIFL